MTASGEWRIVAGEQRDVPPFTFAVQAKGPIDFLVLAVWSQRNDDFRYVRAVIRAIECYRDLIVSQPTVIVGDFNSNTIWDYKRPEMQKSQRVGSTLGITGSSQRLPSVLWRNAGQGVTANTFPSAQPGKAVPYRLLLYSEGLGISVASRRDRCGYGLGQRERPPTSSHRHWPSRSNREGRNHRYERLSTALGSTRIVNLNPQLV